MKKQVGLWIDHRKRDVIVKIEDEAVETGY